MAKFPSSIRFSGSAISFALLSVTTLQSNAAVTFYSSLTDWQAVSPTSATHGFSTSTDPDLQIEHGVVTPVTGPVNVYYETAGGVNRTNNHIEFDTALLNFTTDTSGNNQTVGVTFSFDTPVTGFGFDIQGVTAAGSSWVFLVDGELFNVRETIGAGSGFAGFTSTTPIRSISMVNPSTGIELSETLPLTSGGDQVQFLNFYTQSVPEPAVTGLFGLGVAVLGLRRRNRK